MEKFEKLILDTIQKYPSLSVKNTEGGAILAGKIISFSEYNSIPLYDEYELEIEVSREFPKSLPIVREISGKIPEGFNHFLEDGSLCLASGCELIDFAYKDRTLVGYIDKYVMNYLYTASYFSRYKEVPFGERSHGIVGIQEAYQERYQCEDEKVLVYLLCLLTGIRRYRGHHMCPCGSNKKLRDCHGKLVMEDMKSELFSYYRRDGYAILTDILIRKEELLDDKKDTTEK